MAAQGTVTTPSRGRSRAKMVAAAAACLARMAAPVCPFRPATGTTAKGLKGVCSRQGVSYRAAPLSRQKINQGRQAGLVARVAGPATCRPGRGRPDGRATSHEAIVPSGTGPGLVATFGSAMSRAAAAVIRLGGAATTRPEAERGGASATSSGRRLAAVLPIGVGQATGHAKKVIKIGI